MTDSYQTFVDGLKFDDKGLITAVIQDYKNQQVLMVGYMNAKAVIQTLKGPYVTFYSRSRQKMWVKGESSGHTQTVKDIFVDCDKDCLLISVEQKVAACHKGYRSCFYRVVKDDQNLEIIAKPLFDEKEAYKKS